MKELRLIFAICLALLGIGDAWAIESDDAARAAVRRGATNTVISTRQKGKTSDTSLNTNTVTRATNATTKQPQATRERTIKPRTNTSTTSRKATTPDPKTVSSRTSGNVSARTTTVTRTQTTPATSRVAIASRGATRTPANVRTTSAVRDGIHRASIARSGTDTTDNLRDAIMNSNAKECREIYYSCMDEFCANKDSQLKRCACSSRLHEFDTVKKQLANAEEKMLDFSQRLLTVNMDAEDAAALNIATEGELAFNQKDTSKSKQLLDEIANKLNTNFEDDSFNRNLTAISLSLNEDAAFDTVDSLMGASTTLKTGTALYTAAIPVCREMAAEVCTPEQLSIAESGYQMMIEQDCNTVKKSYQSQTDAARTKVFESGALLDISRLNAYQDKNSDDILTCKRKMLDMLSDTSICGTDLGRCLDMTGQYIDPSTGTAFLTQNLANLGHLITRPTDNKGWTEMPGNDVFVKYLDSKKIFLEPAMKHCQDISDMVWDEFIEDALAQIKLAQDAKLEQVRQSCTTLTTQCLSNASKSLADFDSRALSTFGVLADKTAQAMCADVQNACTALMNATSDYDDASWTSGMTAIATDATYETIISTCSEVGRACIIQACKSVSGNFGLCENIETSVNRNAIIGRTSCWNEVLACVKSAGDDSINRIMDQLVGRNIISNKALDNTPYAFYKNLYGTDATPYDICNSDGKCSDNNYESTQCKACRIAERIWGNCERSPNIEIAENISNRIKKPSNNNETTLLYWFALNTGTEQLPNSCQDTTCAKNLRYDSNTRKCIPSSAYTLDSDAVCTSKRISVPGGENCCETDKIDTWGNCCMNNILYLQATNNKYIYDGYYNQELVDTDTTLGVCVPEGITSAVHVATFAPDGNTGDAHILLCLGTMTDAVTCDGEYMAIVATKNNSKDTAGQYYIPDTASIYTPINYYDTSESDECTYNGTTWSCGNTPTQWKVSFTTQSGN